MTDERGDEPEDAPALDPAREAEVRRLLGDARATGPPPPEVTARLDDALAALGRGEEPDATPGAGAAPVVPLRRRRVRRALVAAGAVAATAVIAVPVTMSVTGSGGGGSSSSTAQEDGAAEVAPEAGDRAGPRAPKPSGGRGLLQDDEQPAPQGQEGAPAGGEVLLSRDDFDEQVTALVATGGVGPVPAVRCGAPGAGRRIAVRYDGALGTVRLMAAGEVVRAELYVCGRSGVVRSLDVPTQ